ncbi:MAG: diguanylate cyclase [Bacteroidales bacterium]|nr:diguanylate cyclase [Bacteroidales bacterium]
MKFPSVSDIASTSVIYVDITSSITNALDIMLEHDHRNIVVADKNCFRILTITDILNIQKNNLNLNMCLSELNLSEIPTITKDKNVLDTLEYLNESKEYICVVNSDGTLYGLITHTDITSNIDPDSLMDNYKLTDYLKLGQRMKWIKKETITSTLFKEMTEKSFDNVMVVENMKPIGILTTKDMMKLIKHKNNLEVPVSKYMSSPVDSIHKNVSIKEALEFVKKKHYKRVVIVDDEGDLLEIISQQELISLSYSRWTMLMKKHQEELSEINNILENKNQKYKIMASTDPLTGLYNRYMFSELFHSSYEAMHQSHNDLSIVLLDIDFFKRINDTYGHNIGDQVLIQITHMLLRSLRNIDIVCRWGGEEFIVLLPTASLDNAVYLAEKLRVYIEGLEIDLVGKLTASFGVSQVKEGDEMKDVIDRADKALYLAKNSGKNCVKMET